jgi:hypothetical protein
MSQLDIRRVSCLAAVVASLPALLQHRITGRGEPKHLATLAR